MLLGNPSFFIPNSWLCNAMLRLIKAKMRPVTTPMAALRPHLMFYEEKDPERSREAGQYDTSTKFGGYSQWDQDICDCVCPLKFQHLQTFLSESSSTFINFSPAIPEQTFNTRQLLYPSVCPQCVSLSLPYYLLASLWPIPARSQKLSSLGAVPRVRNHVSLFDNCV